MKRTIPVALTVMVVAAFVTLSVPTAQVQNRGFQQDRGFVEDRGFVADRWIYPYPQPRHMNRVQMIAHRVALETSRLRREADAQRHHFTWREERSLRQLQALEDAARRFHLQVERYRQNPARTDAEFRNLVGAYYRASFGFRNLHAMEFVRDDFAALGRLIDRLMYFYDGYQYLGGGPGSRYDQNRHDRDRYDRNRPFDDEENLDRDDEDHD